MWPLTLIIVITIHIGQTIYSTLRICMQSSQIRLSLLESRRRPHPHSLWSALNFMLKKYYFVLTKPMTHVPHLECLSLKENSSNVSIWENLHSMHAGQRNWMLVLCISETWRELQSEELIEKSYITDKCPWEVNEALFNEMMPLFRELVIVQANWVTGKGKSIAADNNIISTKMRTIK